MPGMFERVAKTPGQEGVLRVRNIPAADCSPAAVYPPFRSLRRALLVSELHHLTRAAESLRRSQSAITRSILNVERFLGCELFERRTTGMINTRQGDVLFPRVRAALDQLAAAEHKLRRMPVAGSSTRRPRHILHLDVANASVFVFLALYDHHDITRAAVSLDIAPSSVRKSIGALERQLGIGLFERTARGPLVPSDTGRILATHLKRALWEIRAGLDELRSLNGRIAGSVRIGVMSTARSLVVPRAVDILHKRYPDVVVSIHWGNYRDLEVALSCGDIDFIVGTLRPEDVCSTENVTATLMKDRVEVVARAGHPLSKAGDLSLKELLSLDWILPPKHFPLRAWFRELLVSKGLREPRPFIETASLAILRGSLLESDCVALSTRLQCWHEIVEHAVLDVLPIAAFSRPRVERPLYLHLSRRANGPLSPAAEALCATLTDVASRLDDDRLATEWTRATA